MSDPFATTRSQFALPEGVTYLDGNSLGPLPVAVAERMRASLDDEWGERLIRGWNDCGWLDAPKRIGNRLAPLLGAAPDTIMLGDTLSLRIYQALGAALALHPRRRIVLSDTGNFPSDLYMAEALLQQKAQGHSLRCVAPEAVADHLDEEIACLLLTHVDYRSGRLHDMRSLTERAHAHGIPVVWDLAHSAGAVELDLAGCDVDFAAGCTYKYLNGGPGSPAFVYVAPRLLEHADSPFHGWLGHRAPFAFDARWHAAEGIEAWRVGTPPVLALAALDAALDVWEQVDMAQVRTRAVELSALFIDAVEAQCTTLSLASPRDPGARGSQVSFHCSHGDAVMQALIAEHGVIGDFRAPDLLRFGITPLYLDASDVRHAVACLAEVLTRESWRKPCYQRSRAVT